MVLRGGALILKYPVFTVAGPADVTSPISFVELEISVHTAAPDSPVLSFLREVNSVHKSYDAFFVLFLIFLPM